MENNDIQTIEPIWTENFTAIAMSSSDEYIPYLSVCLQSLVEHASNEHNYDIVIFSASENKYNKDLIINTYSSENISIRFFNPQNILQDLKMNITHSYFNEACYFRIIAPQVMKNYEKLIFTDIDLVFNTDIKDLYEINISEYPLAACKEPLWKIFIQEKKKICNQDLAKYSRDILNLENIHNYFNTGVMLINIKYFNQNNYVEKLKKLINENSFIYQEQCAINKLLNNKIFELDKNWNCEISESLSEKPTSANIIHYLGGKKPWNFPEENYSYIWWQYARKSYYYELIIKRMTFGINGAIRCAFRYRKNIIYYWFYKILSNLTFGKFREQINNKRNNYKAKIWRGKNLRGIK